MAPNPSEQPKIPEKPKEVVEDILVSEVHKKLGALEDDVKAKGISNIVEDIKKDPDVEIKSDKLSDFIEKKEWGNAIKEFMNIVRRLFSVKHETGFSEYTSLEAKIKSIDLNNASKEQLETYIKSIEKNIEEIPDIKKDLKLTYIISKIKNQLVKVNNPWKEMNDYQLFAQNIHPWDILLFNKKLQEKDIWADLLKAYDTDFETDFIHSAIVSEVKDNGEISILHSTTDDYKKVWTSWWVREEPLKNYFQRWWVQSCDFLVLKPGDVSKQKMLAYAKANIWKGYDNNAAIWGGIYRQDMEGTWVTLKKWTTDDYFNCVEIIAKWLDIQWIQDITHPNEFLKFMSQLQPSYMTTIDPKNVV